MAIEGNLSDMSLPSLIQMACQEGNQARLRLRRGDVQAFIYFAEGNIAHAESGEEEGESVVYHVMTWEEGEFVLESGVSSPSRTIYTPWSALLVDALHRRDESCSDSPDIDLNKEEYDMVENLQDVLVELGEQIPGFMAASLVGMDGLPIVEHATGGTDVENIAAQMTVLLKLVDTSVGKLKVGTVEDYLLTTDKAYLLIRFLEDKHYYLGIGASRDNTNIGTLRLYSRLYAERLSKAMPS